MPLRPELLVSLKRAYAADFGRALDDSQADALGTALLDVLGPALLERRVVHRSPPPAVDQHANKRDAVDRCT